MSARRLVERFFAAYGAEPGLPQACSNDPELLRLMAALRRSSPGGLKLLDLIAEGDLVLAIFDLCGAQGRATRWGGAVLLRVVNGLIAEHWLVPEMSDLPALCEGADPPAALSHDARGRDRAALAPGREDPGS